MSLQVRLIRLAIKFTPKFMILTVANLILRDIGRLTDFCLDLDRRSLHAQVKLFGEASPIDVWMKGFYVFQDGRHFKVLVQEADSNRIWLDNLLWKVVGKPWKIPSIPELRPQFVMLSELLRGPSR